MNPRILTAMSGGVDSSVAALLLLQQVYATAGATMRFFTDEDIGGETRKAACSADAIHDARRVCERLQIEHHVFDLCDEFRRCVMTPFADSYMSGETPNPCIQCNRTVKFPVFLEKAMHHGYDCIATGHYARIAYDAASGRYVLKKAVDEKKDQSYVLYSLSQEILSRTLLPLGELYKSEIRQIAEENGFINADKPDSQDICFIPDGDYAAFLENVMHRRAPRGEFVRENGMTVGQHKGLHHYTIGQRKGLGIAAEKPLYVIRKEIDTNRVILGDNASLFTDELSAVDCNWIAIDTLTAPVRVTAKTRYNQAETPATVYPVGKDSVYVRFDTPQRAVTAGQAVVFYDGEIVVGGGTITQKGDVCV